jgi:hypothetical protein
MADKMTQGILLIMYYVAFSVILNYRFISIDGLYESAHIVYASTNFLAALLEVSPPLKCIKPSSLSDRLSKYQKEILITWHLPPVRRQFTSLISFDAPLFCIARKMIEIGLWFIVIVKNRRYRIIGMLKSLSKNTLPFNAGVETANIKICISKKNNYPV